MKIGIAGGIGSGKSYVCQRIKALGFDVYDCDREAKRLMVESPAIRDQFTRLLGPGVYDCHTDADGTTSYRLNKAVVAQFLLASERNAKAINEIVHPVVFEDFEQSGLQWMESALMFDSGIHRLVDKVIAVVAPEEVRIARVMARDHITREQVLEWMGRQMSQDEIIKRSDFTLINDGTTDIDKQLHKIIKQCNRSF